jgi:hypothetical protein
MSGLFTNNSPQQQPIYPGSYIYVTNGMPASNALTGLTLEGWVRPSLDLSGSFPYPGGFEGLITQYDTNQAGFGLFIEVNPTNYGSVAFYVGDGSAVRITNWLQADFDFVGTAMQWTNLTWHHIAGTWNGATQSLWIDGQLAASRASAGPVKPGPAPLRLGAYGENGLSSHFYNGDVAFPVIYNRALSVMEISNQFNQVHPGGPPPQPVDTNNVPSDVLACWPLMEEGSNSVSDITTFHRDGQIINHGTWMIGGPSFNAAAVGEFDGYNPTTDPTRGHGLRLASDDLFDCGWTNTFSWFVTNNSPSGVYVARLRVPANLGPNALYDHITFIVRKPDAQPPATNLLVFPITTCIAYNSQPFQTNAYSAGLLFYLGTGGNDTNISADLPGYSAYRIHQNGAPTAHIGVAMPMPSADPYATYEYTPNGYAGSHLT